MRRVPDGEPGTAPAGARPRGGPGWTRAALLACALVAAVACDDLVGPDSERVLGTLAYTEGGQPRVTAPDTVVAGQAFTVTVVTTWPDGCGSKDETEVRASSSEVHVIPWDRVVTDEEGTCTGAVQEMVHSVTLSRATPAVLGLTIHGRRRLENGDRVEVQISRVLVVRAP